MNRFLLSSFLYIIFFAVFHSKLSAQTWEYFKHAGGNNWDTADDIEIDKNGNIYMTGYITDSAMFGNTQIKSNGVEDIFVSKHDAAGNLLWVRSGGGQYYDYAEGIALDNQGNCYVTGRVQGNVKFDYITSFRGSQDIFLAKYNSNGLLQWVEFAGSNTDDYCNSIATDPDGNSYITGSTGGSSVFGTKSLSPSGTFVAKYNTSGKICWVKKYGGGGQEEGDAIVLDNSGHFYFTGEYGNTAFFGTNSISSISGSEDVFCAKADTSGTILWVKSMGGNLWDFSGGIDVDKDGNVYCTGGFQDVGTFGTETLTAGSYVSIFITKFTTNGNFVWAKKAGASCCDYSNDIKVSAAGDLFITGSFDYPGLFGSILLDGNDFYVFNGDNSFVAKYDSSGNALWATSGGPFDINVGTYNSSNAVTVDNMGYVYFAGAFTGNFIYGANQDTAQVNTVRDIYWAKIKDEDFTTSITQASQEPNKNFLIYPNPNQGSFDIKSLEGGFSFEIADMLGNTIRHDIAKSGAMEINNLRSGIYLLKIRNSNNDEIYFSKVVVQ